MYNTSPNMSLTIPVVLNEPGPTYATDINQSLTLIDAHDHSTGKGLQITPAGLNINVDLTFNSVNATSLRSTRYTPQGSPLALATDLDCLYFSGVDLWANDGNGNQIRLTQSGSIVGTSGSITGLTAPATASYNPGSSTFIWQSAVNTPASMDFASAIFRNLTAASNGITVQAPSALASNYGLTLPLLPASTSFVQLTAAGVLSASIPTSQGITASNIASQTITAAQIANATITTTQISASAGITGGQIAASTITYSNLAGRPTAASASVVGDVALSASSGVFATSSNAYTKLTLVQTNVSITAASPAVATVSSTSALYVGQPVIYTGGTLPTGVVSGTQYYISNIINSTTYNISTTVFGANLNTTGSNGSGATATNNAFSIAIATTGRPVCIKLIPDGSLGPSNTGSSLSCFSTLTDSSLGDGMLIKLTRNTTDIMRTPVVTNVTAVSVNTDPAYYIPPSNFAFIDTGLAAGNYAYFVSIAATQNGGVVGGTITDCKLVVYEL